jgi:hypothetical protein
MGKCVRLRAAIGAHVVVAALMGAVPAAAQSAVAGVVRDTTGLVLPGVNVEVNSPALIEKTRTLITVSILDRPRSRRPPAVLARLEALKKEAVADVESKRVFTQQMVDQIIAGAPGHGEGHNAGMSLIVTAVIAAKKIMHASTCRVR